MKKFLVSEMTKEMKDKVKMKAEAFNLSIDELIIESINGYNVPINCLSCHLNQVTYITHEQTVSIGKDEVHIKIEGFPTVMCESCHCKGSASPESEGFLNVKILVLIMEQIEAFVIEEKYKRRKTNANEFVFNFNDLLKIK